MPSLWFHRNPALWDRETPPQRPSSQNRDRPSGRSKARVAQAIASCVENFLNGYGHPECAWHRLCARESRRSHANHGECHAIQSDFFAYECWVTSKRVPPQLVADHDDGIFARSSAIRIDKATALCRMLVQNLEIVACGCRPQKLLHLDASKGSFEEGLIG